MPQLHQARDSTLMKSLVLMLVQHTHLSRCEPTALGANAPFASLGANFLAIKTLVTQGTGHSDISDWSTERDLLAYMGSRGYDTGTDVFLAHRQTARL